jgi:hypothetical protein
VREAVRREHGAGTRRPSVVWAVDDPDSALGRTLAGPASDADRREKSFELQLSLIAEALGRRLTSPDRAEDGIGP